MRAETRCCAIIVMGVSGSGKTTVGKALADRLGWRFADGDDFHPETNIAKMRTGTPLTDADREPWLRAIAAEIDRNAARGQCIVIACSALRRAYRDILVGRRDDVALIYLNGDKTTIAQRLAARKDHFMPPGLLDSQFDALEPPTAGEPAIAVSIDQPVDSIVNRVAAKLRKQRS